MVGDEARQQRLADTVPLVVRQHGQFRQPGGLRIVAFRTEQADDSLAVQGQQRVARVLIEIARIQRRAGMSPANRAVHGGDVGALGVAERRVEQQGELRVVHELHSLPLGSTSEC
ncbi:hypothetical protein D9M72_650070 [compost metagenome]